jgi:2-isopropylmalate synthase
VQGTINGYGERCGNANLCAVLPDLELKMGIPCLPEGRLAQLYDLAHYVSETANLSQDEHMAYVGKAAFAHKGGVHVSAIHRNVNSYQHIDPGKVGNALQVVVSELSGKSNLVHKIEEYNLGTDHKVDVNKILKEVKSLEAQGFSFEAADASVVLMLRRQEEGYTAPFELMDFNVMVEHRQGRGIFSEATVKVCINDEVQHTAGEGNGPVAALDSALRKALVQKYPQITKFHLSDYKVRILDTELGTSATTRVLIETDSGNSRWNTVGASANIIEASWRALADSVEYGLMQVK